MGVSLARAALYVVYLLVLVEAFSAVYLLSGVSRVWHRPAYWGGHIAEPADQWRTEHHPWGAWHRPDARGRQRKACFDVLYTSNAVGARDRAHPEAFDGRRLLMLGDSFVEGYGLNDAETLPAALERELGAPVMNFGAAGDFGPVQAFLLYRDLASRFEHSEVLIGFLPDNDLEDNDPDLWRYKGPRYRPYWRPAGDGYEIFHRVDPPDGPRSFADLRRRAAGGGAAAWLDSVLLNATWSHGIWREVSLLIRLNSGDETGFGKRRSRYFEFSERRLAAAVHFLKRIKTAAGARPVTVFVIPRPHDLAAGQAAGSPAVPPIVAGLRDALEPIGVRVIDLLGPIRTLSDGDPRDLYLSCDGHWTAAGAAGAARVLARELSAPAGL